MRRFVSAVAQVEWHPLVGYHPLEINGKGNDHLAYYYSPLNDSLLMKVNWRREWGRGGDRNEGV